MKVLHLCLANFYIDNYSYQENLLTKYHKKLGLDVEIIASLVSFDENGEITLLKNSGSYINEDGIPVTRLEYKDGFYNKKLRQYKGVFDSITKSNPDIIFIHGCQFLDIKEVVKYVKKHSEVKVYVDNHADFSNSATNWLSKNILHKIIWRYCAQLINPHTTKFYGVLPARVEFLKYIYKIPESKVELLVMGADDEKVEEANRIEVRRKIRNQFDIKENDFLILTGGKIDLHKLQVLDLMKAIIEMNNSNIKLIVYGSVVNELKAEVEKLSNNELIKYIGWINNDQSYQLFSAADLIVFPGRHSVYWEQAVAMGKPLIVKYWEGTTHIDIGNNCIFLYKDSEKEMLSKINDLIGKKNNYEKLVNNAQKDEKNKFLYSKIAKDSIEVD